jgi:hypothetical protein
MERWPAPEGEKFAYLNPLKNVLTLTRNSFGALTQPSFYLILRVLKSQKIAKANIIHGPQLGHNK